MSMEHKNEQEHTHSEKEAPAPSDRRKPIVPTREDVAESRRFVESITRRRRRRRAHATQ